MGRFLERALNAVLGDVEESVRRDIEKVTREARFSRPKDRGLRKSVGPGIPTPDVSGRPSFSQVSRGGVTAQFDQGLMHIPADVRYPPDEERYLLRNAAGEPVIKERRPAPADTDWLKVEARRGLLTVPVSIDPDIIQDRWEEQTAFGSMLADLARRQSRMTEGEALAADHIRRFHHCGGYHEEPVTTLGGIVVSWICRNCSYVRYSVAWIVNGENEEE